MTVILRDQLKGWSYTGPRIDEIVPPEGITAADFAKLQIPVGDRLWVLTRFMPESAVRPAAEQWARRACGSDVAFESDPEVLRALIRAEHEATSTIPRAKVTLRSIQLRCLQALAEGDAWTVHRLAVMAAERRRTTVVDQAAEVKLELEAQLASLFA